MNIRIFKIKSKKEKKQVLDALAKEAHSIYEARKEEVLEQLDNDVQKIIFLDWFNGGALYDGFDKENHQHIRADRYSHVSEEDWDKASSYIMETICMGMG